MYSTLKGLIKKTPPMKWLLWRLNKLEKALQDSRNSDKQLKAQIAKLEKVIQEQRALNDQNTAKINRLEKTLKDKNNDIRREMKYLYYKGLHPDQYAENLKEWYKERTGKTLNLEHPETYNEKIQWMKLYDSTPIKTRLADKYLVREWVAEKIGEEYLIPLLGVYDKFDDINFDKLPDKFVIKTNHGSGANRIITDKSKLNMQELRDFFNRKMRENFAFVYGLELHYKDIIPKIIIEEYIENSKNALYDYRFFVFDGVIKAIWLDVDSGTPRHRRNIFSRDWELQPLRVTWPFAPELTKRPENLDEMIRIAELLGQGFSHVRVDLYEVKGRIYFGEMTFTHMSGTGKWDPVEYDRIYGDYIKLPSDK